MDDTIQGLFNESQWEEAAKLLSERWKINGINPGIIKDKIVLDVGCGSGRYSYALRLLGAKKVVGVDEGEKSRKWPEGITYKRGKILSLPFENRSFDFVFSNGRLSHLVKWEKGIEESYRVLKPGGWVWLSLFGQGKVWDYADRIRKKMSPRDAEDFQKALLLRDWEPGKVFFLLDLFFCEERIYFTRKGIKRTLEEKGFKKVIFLDRGTKKDLNEKIFQEPSLRNIYGEGEIRLIAQKE